MSALNVNGEVDEAEGADVLTAANGLVGAAAVVVVSLDAAANRLLLSRGESSSDIADRISASSEVDVDMVECESFCHDRIASHRTHVSRSAVKSHASWPVWRARNRESCVQCIAATQCNILSRDSELR